MNDKALSRLKIAVLLSVITALVFHTNGYVTQFGFPTVWMTYYGYPGTNLNGNGFFDVIRRFAITPQQIFLNIGIYYLLLKLIVLLKNRMAGAAQ